MGSKYIRNVKSEKSMNNQHNKKNQFNKRICVRTNYIIYL